MTPEDRTHRARSAAKLRWAKPGAREAHSERMRRVRFEQAERKVDPAGQMSAADRRAAAFELIGAEMDRLSFLARRKRTAGGES